MAKKAKPAKPASKLVVSPEAARLATVIETWRSHRTIELSQLAHRASVVAARGREAITGTNPAELHDAWLAVERKHDAVDLDRLLAPLTEPRCEHAIDRLAKLAKRPSDPRILEKLVAICQTPRDKNQLLPFTSMPNRPFWNSLLALLETLGDATVIARLEAVIGYKAQTNFETWLATKLGKMLPDFASIEPAPLDATTQAAIAEIEKQLARAETEARPSADTGDALYSAVWAAPDDDAPRQVLADFLSERGDPRGEFISLQLARAAGKLDADGKKREKELLKRHKKQWLGPIAPLIQPHNMRFERGFLVTCQLEPNAELQKTLGNHPAWSTIREYLIHWYSIDTAEGHALQAVLQSHGAQKTNRRFTRGIE